MPKPTDGDVRRLDPVGRINLPKEMAKELGWSPGDYIRLRTDGKQLIVNKVRLVDER